MALANPLTVVSSPAVSSERTRMGASSAVISPASCAAQESRAIVWLQVYEERQRRVDRAGYCETHMIALL